MRSLRWRIAMSYAALFVVAIAIAAVSISFGFRSLLLDQVAVNVLAVSDEIARAIEPRPGFSITTDQPVDLILSDPRNLEAWASATVYVQIDNAHGYPFSRSSNIGGMLLPAALNLTLERPIRVTIMHAPFDDLLVLDRALVVNGRIVAVAHVAARLALIESVLSRARNILFAVTGLALVLVVIASFAVARNAIDPINRLTVAMDAIGSEQLDRRLGWSRRKDELGHLAATFDRMLDRLQDAFARERQFISDASHELKTPLTVINANAQMLRRWADRDETVRAESLTAIIDESAGLAGMVNGMLLLAKADSGDRIPKAPVDLERIVSDAVAFARPKADLKGLDLEYVHPGESTIVLGADGLLRQLCTNLIDNAIKFTEAGGVQVRLRAEAGTVVVEVADTGIGIDEEALRRVFDRFYRTDRSRTRQVEGTGLGLAIVRSIARVHAGEVRAVRNDRAGVTFVVTLPREPVIIESS